MINFFVGLWVLLSPFVLGFAMFESLVWNNVIVGIAIMAIAASRAWGRRGPGLSWINFILGLWLIVSAFIFDTQMNATVVWNQVISGAVVSIVAAMSALARRPYTRTSDTDILR
jgi:hypothetical protein